MLDKWSKKEKPVFTGITRGVGGFGFGGGGGAGAIPFSASGGTKIVNGSYFFCIYSKWILKLPKLETFSFELLI